MSTVTFFEIEQNPHTVHTILEHLHENPFPSVEEERLNAVYGFSPLYDGFSQEYDFDLCVSGNYVTFALRKDKKSVPKALIKSELRKYMKNYCLENNTTIVPSAVKTEFTEEIIFKLAKMAMFNTTLIQVVWNVSANTVALYSGSNADRDAFLRRMEHAFNVVLHLVSPYYLVKKHPKSSAVELTNDLGRTFLLWLYWKACESGEILGASLEVLDATKLRLADIVRTVKGITLVEDLYTKHCIVDGYSVEDLRLSYVFPGDMVFTLTLTANFNCIKSFGLPRALAKSDLCYHDEELALIEQLYDVVVATWDEFIDQFLDKLLWEKVKQEFNDWILEGNDGHETVDLQFSQKAGAEED